MGGASPAVVPSPLMPGGRACPDWGAPPTGAPTLSRPGGVGVSAAGAGAAVPAAPPVEPLCPCVPVPVAPPGDPALDPVFDPALGLGPPVVGPADDCAGPSAMPVREAPSGPSMLKPRTSSSASTAAPIKKYISPVFSRPLVGCGADPAGDAARWLEDDGVRVSFRSMTSLIQCIGVAPAEDGRRQRHRWSDHRT